MTEYTVFNASDYLTDEDVIAEYLAAAAEDPNPEVLAQALINVATLREAMKDD